MDKAVEDKPRREPTLKLKARDFEDICTILIIRLKNNQTTQVFS
jgi:hypothetical protein